MQTVPGFWQEWWSENTVAEAMRSTNGLAFGWEGNSQILGFVCTHDMAFRGYLSELVVSTDTHRVLESSWFRQSREHCVVNISGF
jgi:hypothetical protein